MRLMQRPQDPVHEENALMKHTEITSELPVRRSTGSMIQTTR